MKKLIASAFVVLATAGSVLAAGDSTAFEKLKALVGTWKGMAKVGDSTVPTTVKYRVISGGTAVEETIAPGGDHEMVTMYFMDGKSLVLTHYCAMGNEPHMKLQTSSTSTDLKFDFASCSNLKPGDAHMHSMNLKIVDPDHIQTEWFAEMGGKPMMHIQMDLRKQGK